MIFWKISSFTYKFSGNLASNGFYSSKIFFQMLSLSLLVRSFKTVLKGDVEFDKSKKSLYIFSVIKDGNFSGS